jgi:hypothetical protein
MIAGTAQIQAGKPEWIAGVTSQTATAKHAGNAKTSAANMTTRFVLRGRITTDRVIPRGRGSTVRVSTSIPEKSQLMKC